MKFEEQYLDVLQNLETAIISVYDDDPELLDLEVADGLDALIRAYTCEINGRRPGRCRLTPRAQVVLDRCQRMSEWRLGRSSFDEGEPEPHSPGLPELAPADLRLCLKRIRNSVRFWNREGGRQGYLNYVRQFLGTTEKTEQRKGRGAGE